MYKIFKLKVTAVCCLCSMYVSEYEKNKAIDYIRIIEHETKTLGKD